MATGGYSKRRTTRYNHGTSATTTVNTKNGMTQSYTRRSGNTTTTTSFRPNGSAVVRETQRTNLGTRITTRTLNKAPRARKSKPSKSEQAFQGTVIVAVAIVFAIVMLLQGLMYLLTQDWFVVALIVVGVVLLAAAILKWVGGDDQPAEVSDVDPEYARVLKDLQDLDLEEISEQQNSK